MANPLQKVKETITLENAINAALKAPGARIDREAFLRKELSKYCQSYVVDEAIRENPARAGISKDIIDKLSKSIINYETNKVSTLSVAASLPNSGPMATAAAATDIVSYYVFILRAVQELLYLYGFPQLDLNDNQVDSETMNTLLVTLGVMHGVNGAVTALRKLADNIAVNVAKKLANKALMRTAYYPIVKKIAKMVGVRMTKQIFADTVASAVPVIGAVASGGLTFAMFKPCCIRLKKSLMTYPICDPEFYRNQDRVQAISESIELPQEV
jgi:hypothetical protein